MSDEMKAQLAAMRERLELATEELPPYTEITFQAMFGGIGAKAQGRMFASLSDRGLALKLPETELAALLAIEGAEPLQYEPDAPVSKSYVVVPPAFLEDTILLAPWAEKSVHYVLTLPAPKKRAPKKA